MRYFTFLVLIHCYFLSTQAFAQSMQEVHSKVISATVFSERALISREARINLSRGTHQLLLSDLTASLRSESVRVSGEGTAGMKILDVQVDEKVSAGTGEAITQKLTAQLDSLKAVEKMVDDKIKIARAQKNFIESLQAASTKNLNQKIAVQKLDIHDWQSMLTFINEGLDQVYAEIRQQENHRGEINETKRLIQHKLRKRRSTNRKSSKQIKVTLAVETAGEAVIQASYLVTNASWRPIYDARVSTENRKMELTYFAMVKQGTGEHWQDVALTLSTAQPMTIKSLPQLQPLHLSVGNQRLSQGIYVNRNATVARRLRKGIGAITGTIIDRDTGDPLSGANVVIEGTALGAATNTNGFFMIENIPAGNYQVKCSFIGFKEVTMLVAVIERNAAQISVGLPREALEVSEISIVAADPEYIGHATATVTQNKISAVFVLPTKNNILSDDTAHKVTIAILPFELALEYCTIPKLVAGAFLRGKLVNDSDYPLLAGEVNIFMENDFVNRMAIPVIVPRDSFKLSLGLDDAIKVERKEIMQFTESKGLFGSKVKETFEYEIHLTNNHLSSETIRVYDQLPIAGDEKIKVQLLSPNQAEINLDKQNRIAWQVALKPGESRVLHLKYKVEYPEDVILYGLK